MSGAEKNRKLLKLLEMAIEGTLNAENEEKAREIFREFFVEKMRELHQQLVESEEKGEDFDVESSLDLSELEDEVHSQLEKIKGELLSGEEDVDVEDEEDEDYSDVEEIASQYEAGEDEDEDEDFADERYDDEDYSDIEEILDNEDEEELTEQDEVDALIDQIKAELEKETASSDEEKEVSEDEIDMLIDQIRQELEKESGEMAEARVRDETESPSAGPYDRVDHSHRGPKREPGRKPKDETESPSAGPYDRVDHSHRGPKREPGRKLKEEDATDLTPHEIDALLKELDLSEVEEAIEDLLQKVDFTPGEYEVGASKQKAVGNPVSPVPSRPVDQRQNARMGIKPTENVKDFEWEKPKVPVIDTAKKAQNVVGKDFWRPVPKGGDADSILNKDNAPGNTKSPVPPKRGK